MADIISQIKLPDNKVYDIKDNSKVAKTGDTMTGNLTAPKFIGALDEANLTWGGKSLAGNVTPIGMSLSMSHNANRLAFINGDLITSEFSADNGATWTAHNLTTSQKSWFFTDSVGINVGKQQGSTEACTLNSKTRITITAQDGTNPSDRIYISPKKMLIQVSSANGLSVLVEYRTGTNYLNNGAWSTFGTYTVYGWSGWNDIPLVIGTLGGDKSQTSNVWQLRLTFSVTSLHSNESYRGVCTVASVRIFSDNIWVSPSTIASTNHLYSYDADKNAYFPANVTATKFIGALQGNANTASNAQTVNGHTVNSDVPSNATFTDTTYTFANGTNGFTVTPSGGTAQTVTVTPSISNNVTGSGTSGYLAKFNGANTITNGAQLGSDTTKFLRNDGTWAVPPGAGGGVTGVKGNAESTYRTGNVNLTPANLGLESKSAASGGTDLSLVTTGEKAVWNGKPSTDTKNTAGSTDTSSQIYLIGATSQAANPQTYSQDTAYVGTDGCLYSGGTKVEVVSNNAGYHNSIYRGKSLGTSITTAQWNAISAGTFDDMYIGDYWTLSTTIGSTISNIQYVIAGFDYWWNCGDSYPQSSNKHHVVLVPVGYLYLAHMNATNITTGGYIGSAMYTTNLEIARTGISTLFGNHLYSVRRLFTNSVNTVGQATGWAWATSSVDLMSETMVYGHPVWTTSGFEVGVDRTILPLFALNPASASISSNWWLRSVATPSYFARVNSSGNAACDNASLSNGVRPAFAIY